MSKKNRAKVSILALALVACMAVVGISAYFTDGASVTNEFTVGSIEIQLDEPNWEEPTDPIVPGQEFEKDPTVKNIGENDAYAFVKVEVPAATVKMANADGSAAGESFQELFTYTLNTGWVELVDEKEQDGDSVTHVYAYVGADAATMEKMAKDAVTPAVFDSVKLINLAEGNTAVEENPANIVVSAYAIQADHLEGNVAAPAQVWAIVEAAAVAMD